VRDPSPTQPAAGVSAKVQSGRRPRFISTQEHAQLVTWGQKWGRLVSQAAKQLRQEGKA